MTSAASPVARTCRAAAGAALAIALAACATPPARVPASAGSVPTPAPVQASMAAMPAAVSARMSAAVAPGRHAGIVAMAWQGGVTRSGAWGHRDLARREPIADDAIFRIYSMSKPIASVALLQLVDDGAVSLDDPLSRWLPGFDAMQVVANDGDAPRFVAAPRPPTLRHLLTHTSGYTEDAAAHPAAAARLAAAGVDDARDLADVAARLAGVPLAEAPGTHFHYAAANTELVARVVEVASGRPFAEVLQSRIFAPLDMRDTAFEVPARDRGRVVDLATTRDGALVLADTGSARVPGSRLRAWDSAAGGLYSTAGDYLRFARMLLGGGALDGVRVLSPASAALLHRDQLAAATPPIAGPAPGEGFGLGVGVVFDTAARGRAGGTGQYGWPGAASTWFVVDPVHGIAAVLMAQYLPSGDRAVDLPRPGPDFQALLLESLP